MNMEQLEPSVQPFLAFVPKRVNFLQRLNNEHETPFTNVRPLIPCGHLPTLTALQTSKSASVMSVCCCCLRTVLF